MTLEHNFFEIVQYVIQELPQEPYKTENGTVALKEHAPKTHPTF